ncbi:MAG: aspartate aminotransferase family protein [Phaeodactylibacter sp.]|nr:aspartate aminotransferase family protein [Phaeodactylibacter sp.]MCB9293234.1 aspartate aminotransferase family protein [Lewinellaceae bacterium]
MKTTKELLEFAALQGITYLEGQPARRPFPAPAAIQELSRLDFRLPEQPTDPGEVIRLLGEAGSPAAVGNTGGRYFGFVIGGSLPVAVAANWLAGAWDQNAGLKVTSPLAAKLEEVAAQWLLEVLGLPSRAGVGFVTGATMANFCGLAAARHALLKRQGWNVEAQGLYGAPEIKVVVGEEAHVSPLKALSLLGFGSERVARAPINSEGEIRPDQLPPLDDRTIICLQAGNVNSGAIDPLYEICRMAQARGAWVHIDGAFGLWGAASPRIAHQLKGHDLADSWAADLHKWLNVPYDSGVVICRDPQNLRAAMSINAAYIPPQEEREPYAFTPEMSRRARGAEAWAALYALGKSGVAELVDRCCRHAALFAKKLKRAGFEVLNEVNLNQVLVSFGSDELTRRVIAELQKEGTCWCGSTTWQGRHVMRISVSSWATTEEDVEICADAMVRIAKREKSFKLVGY